MSIKELLKDEAFAEQINAAASLEEVATLLKAKGADVTAQGLKSAMNAEEGELDEDALDAVAGGLSILSWIKLLFRSGNTSRGGGNGSFGSGGSAGGR